MSSAPEATPARTRSTVVLVRALGAALVLVCLVLLGRALVDGYDEVADALDGAAWYLVGVALVASAAAMGGLAALWRESLRSFGWDRRLTEVSAWYFAGELGKYLPGGVWTVVGRAEVATRAGIDRSTAYATVAVSLLVTIVGGIWSVALLAATAGTELGWVGSAALVAGVVAVAVMHPRVIGYVARLVRAASGGRFVITPQPWRTMLRLAALSVPTWALVGVGAWLVAQALHLDGSLPRLGAAAIAAWVAGLVAVPVPAGAGVRELVFVEASGLPPGPAVVLATGARLLFILVDGLGGVAALGCMRRGLVTGLQKPSDTITSP